MFKVLSQIIATLAIVVVIYFFVLGFISKSRNAAGLVSGMLAPCPDKPNCVCSDASEDASHYIAPLNYSDTISEKAWSAILQALKESGGKIGVSDEDYIAATFSVSIFRFIDDVECRLDTSNKKIHIRSASRVGNSDLGVNKKRVETIRGLFKQKLQWRF